MEARRSDLPARGRHERTREYAHQRTREHGETTNPRMSKRLLAGAGTPLGTLGRGPVPRPREKNDEFIQSWLQQTQTSHSRPPQADCAKERVWPAGRPSPETRATAPVDSHRRRPRSPSDPPHPSRDGAGPVEHRFEKRARHKTKEDKYVYKSQGRGTKKQALERRLRGPDTNSAAGRQPRTAEGKQSTRQRDADAPVSHLLPRSTRLAPKETRAQLGLTRRASEPRASKSSKLTKSQKEDKELEEMSAFFSQRRPSGETVPAEHDLGNPGIYSRGIPLDPEPRYRHWSQHRSFSGRGSEQSFRHVATAEGKLLPRPLSSLPTTKPRDSRRNRSSRPAHKHNDGSVWSQEHDDHRIRAESESLYSRRVRSGASATSAARDAFEPQEESEPRGAAAGPTIRLIRENAQGALNNTSRDAAAQTDPTPERLRRHDEALMTRTRTPQSGRRDNTTVSPGAAAMQDSSRQLSVDRGLEVWPRARLSRHVTHAEPDVECWQTGQDSRYPGPGCDLPVTRRAVGERDPGVNLVVGPGYHRGVAMAPPSNHLSLLDEQGDCANHRLGASEGLLWTGYSSNIMGNFGLENLEDFIQRIEDEAGISQGKLEHEWALPGHTSGVRNDQEPGWNAPSRVGNLGGEVDDEALMLGRDWFPAETGLLGPGVVAGSAAVLGEAERGCLISRPVLESYPWWSGGDT